MPESFLPLSHTRSFKLTIGDREILRRASEVLGVTEAEVLRIAIRRWALLDEDNGLPDELVKELREECGLLPLGPPHTLSRATDTNARLATCAAKPDGHSEVVRATDNAGPTTHEG